MSDELPSSFFEAARRAQQSLPPARPAGGDLAPGDLILLGDLPPDLAELASGVEWALIEKDPARVDRFLVVPADGLELLGSGDLKVGRGGEARVLRCRHPLWLAHLSARPRRSTGQLSATEIAKTRRHLQQLAQGDQVGSLLSRELDESPDYREEVTTPLARLVAELTAAEAKPAKGKPSPPITENPNLKEGRFQSAAMRTWALAASILVALMGFLLAKEAAQLERLRQQQEAAAQEHQQQLAKLETQGEQLEQQKKQLEQEKAQAQQAATAAESRLEATARELEVARKESIIANPELAILEPPGSTRGTIEVELDPRASHLLILIPIDDLDKKQKYRIELIGGKAPWISPELEVLSPGELRLGIPTSVLSEGKVVLRLSNISQPTGFSDFYLSIRRPP